VVSWQRNLAVVWLAQFLSLLGFSVAMPFLPFYVQELGVEDPGAIKLWVSAITAAGSLTMAVCAPLWGMVADRYGRRPMMLRAGFGGAFVLTCMGLAPSVRWLLILRLIQGTLTGTVTAAQTLISVHTPNHRTGFAMGVLSTAVFTGTMGGNVLGGALAESFGYRTVFFVGAVVLLFSALLILFGVRENFVRRSGGTSRRRMRVSVGRVLAAWPILVLIGFMAFCRRFDLPMFPLFVQQVKGTLQGAALWTGSLHAIGSVAALLAGVALGWLADRVSPARIGKLSALGAGILMVAHGMAGGYLQLAAVRFGLLFCAGGLDPVFQIWLAKATHHRHRGILFGWALTTKSVGWTVAPLISGGVAAAFGLSWVYFTGAAFFVRLVPMIAFVVRRMGLADGVDAPTEANDVDRRHVSQ
jgi:DHA1 family multidrug resistance protein-like MFS transporter